MLPSPCAKAACIAEDGKTASVTSTSGSPPGQPAASSFFNAGKAVVFLFGALRSSKGMASPRWETQRPLTSVIWRRMAAELVSLGSAVDDTCEHAQARAGSGETDDHSSSQRRGSGAAASDVLLATQQQEDTQTQSETASQASLRLHSLPALRLATLALHAVSDVPSPAALNLLWDVLAVLLEAALAAADSGDCTSTGSPATAAALGGAKLVCTWLRANPTKWASTLDGDTGAQFVLSEAVPSAARTELWQRVATIATQGAQTEDTAHGFASPTMPLARAGPTHEFPVDDQLEESWQQHAALPEDVAFVGFRPTASGAPPPHAPVLDGMPAALLRVRAITGFAHFAAQHVLLPPRATHDTEPGGAPLQPVLHVAHSSRGHAVFAVTAREASVAAAAAADSESQRTASSSPSQALLTPPPPRSAPWQPPAALSQTSHPATSQRRRDDSGTEDDPGTLPEDGAENDTAMPQADDHTAEETPGAAAFAASASPTWNKAGVQASRHAAEHTAFDLQQGSDDDRSLAMEVDGTEASEEYAPLPQRSTALAGAPTATDLRAEGAPLAVDVTRLASRKFPGAAVASEHLLRALVAAERSHRQVRHEDLVLQVEEGRKKGMLM